MARRRPSADLVVGGLVVPAALLDHDHPTWRDPAAVARLLDQIDPGGEHRSLPGVESRHRGRRFNDAASTFALANGLTIGTGHYPLHPDRRRLAALGVHWVQGAQFYQELIQAAAARGELS